MCGSVRPLVVKVTHLQPGPDSHMCMPLAAPDLQADAATAYPPAVMGDILNGLPPVGNHSQVR